MPYHMISYCYRHILYSLINTYMMITYITVFLFFEGKRQVAFWKLLAHDAKGSIRNRFLEALLNLSNHILFMRML